MADRNQEYVRVMPAILLVAINAKWIHPSLALRLLKANLGDLEKDCEIFEFALRQPLKEKIEPIITARPRLLGISVSIWNHLATLELLKALGEKWEAGQEAAQKPVVVLGGPEASWLGKDAEIFRYADYVIRGEGEESFRSLCAEVFAEISGGSSGVKRQADKKENNAVFIDSDEVDVKKLASPYRFYTGEDLRRKLVYVESGRGCPFDCEFCQSAVMRHKKVRAFPIEPFLKDMGLLIDRGASTFKFLDRTFNLDIKRAKKIMEFFLERIKTQPPPDAPEAAGTGAAVEAGKKAGEKSRPLCVHFEMVPFRFPEELKDLVRRFPQGTLRLELGVQTFKAQTAALINLANSKHPLIDDKKQPEFTVKQPGQTLENLKFLSRDTNAILHVDLIAGLPGEDLASFGAGFDLLWQALSETDGAASAAGKSFEIQLGILKGLPGTPILRHTGAFKMCFDLRPPYEVIETGAMPKKDLDRIKNFARFWELIFNRRPFPDLLPALLPPGEPVFNRFMLLSDKLLESLGKNWGIDRQELKARLTAL